MFKYQESIKRAYEESVEYTKTVFETANFEFGVEFTQTLIRSKLEKQYEKQMFDKWYYVDEQLNLVYKKEYKKGFSCTECDYNDSGLYFIGMCGFNPITEERYYLVKVGESENVKKRIKQYLGMNPMIYNNGNILPLPNESYIRRGEMENNCHEFLSKVSYAKAANANEWFYVTKKKYLELCETFASQDEFYKIAVGLG